MNYDITKQNYETANEWHEEKSRGYLWTAEIEKFLSFLPLSAPRVIDIGCGGSGRDISQFLTRGAAVEGLDYSHAAIESAKQQFPHVPFYESDMTDTKLQSESYDGVWACASLLNLAKRDVPKALAEFNRILKPGGTLFVSVKKGDGERMVPDKAGERFFSFWDIAELGELLTTNGYSVLAVDERVSGHAVDEKGRPLVWLSFYAKKI